MNIIELGEQLRAVGERINGNIQNLERERNYVLETMQKVQSSFGDQPAGQQIVTQLYSVINSLAAADSSLNALHARIDPYINQTRT